MNQLTELISYDPETGILRRKRKNTEISCVDSNGYVVFRLERKHYYAHRVAWFLMTGSWPKTVDHINRIRSDNRWCNLREASRSQNAINRSELAGITFDQKWQKFEVRIQKDGHRYRIGFFDELNTAIAARKQAEKSLFADFAPE